MLQTAGIDPRRVPDRWFPVGDIVPKPTAEAGCHFGALPASAQLCPKLSLGLLILFSHAYQSGSAIVHGQMFDWVGPGGEFDSSFEGSNGNWSRNGFRFGFPD